MNKNALLGLLLVTLPANAAAQSDRAGGSMDSGVPTVDSPAESFDKWLGAGQDGRDLSALVKHLHGRLNGGESGPGLDQALGRADAKFSQQGGADAVQKALLFNGKEAREGLREAYDSLKDYADKLGKAWKVQGEADTILKNVITKQADASKRVKAAATEAKKIAAGIESNPPSSEGGDGAAGELGSLEPQERDIADAKEKLDQAKAMMEELEGKLKGLEAVKARVTRHAERAGLLDRGAGAALSGSLTGKGSKAEAGSSKEIIADALATLEKAGALGEKSRTLMGAIVERLSSGSEKAKEAETAILEAKGEAEKALEGAMKAHEKVQGTIKPAWEAAVEPSEKEAEEAKAAAEKGKASAPACKACALAAAASAQAAGAKAACATCNCAKKKATKAIGEPEKLEALSRLEQLEESGRLST
ncbi:MAG: hypothetical protein FD126_1552 [Elusimicrobia bacterium]|nr:MAG: hypothetical protein FD126_1552 [Elusimicrobiota bacterium]